MYISIYIDLLWCTTVPLNHIFTIKCQLMCLYINQLISKNISKTAHWQSNAECIAAINVDYVLSKYCNKVELAEPVWKVLEQLQCIGRYHKTDNWHWVVLEMGLGNLPAVRDWSSKTGWFGFRSVQTTHPLPLAKPNPNWYPFIHVFCRVWQDLSLPMSDSVFWFSLFIVPLKYGTVNRK